MQRVAETLPYTSIPLTLDQTPPRRTMAKNYQRLWEEVARGTDEAKSVRTLAGIVADKEGRAFISRLERKDAELCIEILDHVGRPSHFFLSPS